MKFKKKIDISYEKLIKDLKILGISNGDTILLHSSLSSIGYLQKGPETLINAILNTIGEEGTLIVPTYSYKENVLNTCRMKDYIFDPKTTPTVLGAIPSYFLKLKNVYRSIHPTHSLSAIGKNAKFITDSHHLDSSTYGEKSPWSKLIEINGKILGIGIDLGPHTIYHHVEDIMGKEFPIKVKIDEKFQLKSKDYEGNLINIPIQPLDPIVSKKRIDHFENFHLRKYFWKIYTQLGILKTGKIGCASSWLTNAKEFCEVLKILAVNNITIYSEKKDFKKISEITGLENWKINQSN